MVNCLRGLMIRLPVSSAQVLYAPIFLRREYMMLAVQQAASEDAALAVIRDELDVTLETVTSEEERARLYRQIVARVKTAAVPKTKVRQDDVLGALGVFC